MSTKIYVEGGGNKQRTIQACRAAFAKYFAKVAASGAQPRIVASGSRQKAYQDFVKGLDDPKYDRVLLLVDAEGPVDSGDAWSHLLKHDRWAKPPGANDNAAHLMVQCMESWFLADKDFLAAFYGEGFHRNALPARSDIEHVPKADVEVSLENATRHSQKKGIYHKTRHGFDILSGIDPQKIEALSPYCRQLHQAVRDR